MRARNEEVSSIFKQIRERHGLKQAEMAEIADCSLRNYQKIESGESQPGYNILRNLVRNLPLDSRELFMQLPIPNERAAYIERIDCLLARCSQPQLDFILVTVEKLLKVWKDSEI